MEAKKQTIAALFTLMAVLLITHSVLNLQQIPKSHVGRSDKYPENTQALGPNLSTCHESLIRPGYRVNCCPPKNPLLESFIDFKFPERYSVPRIRRAAHHLDPHYVALYNKAVSAMKSLPYSDPRSFYRQANAHCLYCTGAYDEINSSNVSSPFSVHGSWLFFPWHRAFLYFHERILRSLVGDKSFTLPYWAWDVPEGMTFPEMYLNSNASSLFNPFRDKSHLPPELVDLGFHPVDDEELPKKEMVEQIQENLALMYTQMVSGAKKTELFMGCSYKSTSEYSVRRSTSDPLDSQTNITRYVTDCINIPTESVGKKPCHQPGTIELAPHSTVHDWVGSEQNPGREDMGSLYSAARDASFYAHHANIDRLWEVWRDIHGNKLDILDPDWLETFFYFYDENSRLVKIKIKDVVDTKKLGYAYEEIPLPWLNSRPKPSFHSKLARQTLKLRTASDDLNHPHRRSLRSSITLRINRPQINRNQREKNYEEEVISILGIVVNKDVYTKFDVYINLIEETVASPRMREFAGTFVHIPKGGRGRGDRSETMDVKFGISELLTELEVDSDESIWVTLLPRSKSCVNVTFNAIRIEYVT